MNKRNLLFVGILILFSASLFAEVSSSEDTRLSGNATISGSNGYIVIPSAEPAWNGEKLSITTGYSGIFTGSYAHVPYFQLGFAKNLELSLAIDISDETDILFGGKWRFAKSRNSSLTFGLVGQMLRATDTPVWAAQAYLASTFTSTFIDWPSKTTLLIGYTFDEPLSTDIDFGMGFQAALFPGVFKEKVDFLIDFGNTSYSVSPSGGNAVSRGMLNLGIRLLPLRFAKTVYFSADLRALDVFDAKSRALSASVAISYSAQ